MVAPCSLLKGLTILTSSTGIGTSKVHNYFAVLSEAFLKRAFESQLQLLMTILNSMFVRLGTDYEIRNGGYFESIKNSANQFISKP